jgi:preprotein translocase subunit YajC
MNEFLVNPYALIFCYSVLFIGIIAMLSKAIYNTVVNEKRQSKYLSEMKVNDSVYFPCASGSINGEILEINEDTVKIVVTVSKKRVYERD